MTRKLNEQEQLTEEVKALREEYRDVKGSHNIWKPVGEGKWEDLTGVRSGKLVAVKPVGRDKKGCMLWLCKCDCNVETIATGTSIKKGKLKSCGLCKNFKSFEGRVFGRWTVIKDGGGKKCLCRCSCGTVREVDKGSLQIGDSLSCGCLQKEKAYKKVEDKMVGRRFGRLVVLKRVEDKGRKPYFLCQCDCGNQKIVRGSHLKQNLIKSCGCYNKERIHEVNFKDLTGKKIGRLLVLSIEGRNDKNIILYRCLCDCGNTIILPSSSLSGKKRTLSCGCLQREYARSKLDDLTGMKFGKLTVLGRTDNTPGGETRYLCRCECGGLAKVTAPNLKSFGTISCGCVKSKGEYIIANILKDNDISFQKQKTFEDLEGKSKGILRYDFYILDKGYIIEYDGVQHFKAGKGWDTEEHVRETQERDKIKNEYCKRNDIPLIRIPYTHLDEICLEDLLLETSKFLI